MSCETTFHALIYFIYCKSCLEYCCHICPGNSTNYLDIFDNSHPQNKKKNKHWYWSCVTSSVTLTPWLFFMNSLLYCLDSMNLRAFIKLPTCSFQFRVELVRCNRQFYANRHFSRNSRSWISLSASWFLLKFHLRKWECNVNRYLLYLQFIYLHFF